MLFARVLRKAITIGRLTLIDAGGRPHAFGQTDSAGQTASAGLAEAGLRPVVIRLHDRTLHRELLLNPRLHFGEGYMDGRLSLEQGTIYDALALFAINERDAPSIEGVLSLERVINGLTPLLRMVQQRNPLRRARANVAHHYDLSGRLYELFLDRDLQYSCAYFTAPGQSLDQAQEAKKRLIAAKLLLRPGQRVLDIGCGWGGLALYLARTFGAEVTGITLSAQQLAVAEARAAREGLDRLAGFRLADYRDAARNEGAGTYDRIVSVGMFEHVGTPHYAEFFQAVRHLLREDGAALLHAIGRRDGPGTTSPWIRKYIFPGGYAPALSEVLPAIERTGLWVTDIEILRLHYAETLRAWRRRFAANRDAIARLYDERFCRMWEFYLAGSEVAFRYQGHMVFQVQLARHQDTVPPTRDYIYQREPMHAG